MENFPFWIDNMSLLPASLNLLKNCVTYLWKIPYSSSVCSHIVQFVPLTISLLHISFHMLFRSTGSKTRSLCFKLWAYAWPECLLRARCLYGCWKNFNSDYLRCISWQQKLRRFKAEGALWRQACSKLWSPHRESVSKYLTQLFPRSSEVFLPCMPLYRDFHSCSA